MRNLEELRAMRAGEMLALWQVCRERYGDDPLTRAVQCNAEILRACCFAGGEAVYADAEAVLQDLSCREMETLLDLLAKGQQPPRQNPAFDLARFTEMKEA